MLDQVFEQEKVKLQKTKRILVYPNFTSTNYQKDSYVDALAMMIKGLNSIRDDLFFHIISPENCEIEALKFYNTHQFTTLHIPTHPPSMRVNFDIRNLNDVSKFLEYDYDIIFSHLPEHTVNLINTLSYKTHFEPAVIGYSHWFDFPGVANWKDVLLNNLVGVLQMDKCFVNTQSQKELVLECARKHFSEDNVTKLDNILSPHYLGISDKSLFGSVNEDTEKIIVFNHRPWAYKDYPNFIKLMDKLYAQRQDFKVWAPLVKKVDKSYMFNDKFDKRGYYEFLSKCRVGFGPKQTYRGWSIAVTDGLMNGCPFILYDSDYYKELCNICDRFDNNESALKLLHKYLNDNDYRNWQAKNQLEHIKNCGLYNANLLSQQIDESYNNIPRVKSDDMIKTMKDIIKKRGSISKKELIKELGWGVSIKWNKYRSALLDEKEIFDSNTKNPVYYYKA